MYSTVDPRGYIIVCDDSTISHINNHEIMIDNSEAIKETIEKPDTIFESNEYTNRDVYFAKPLCATYSKYGLYTKVVVEMDETNNSGLIVTAFPSPSMSGNIKEGGLKYVKPRL